VGHHTLPKQEQQQVCIVDADEFQYLGGIDVFENSAADGSGDAVAAKETVLLDGEGLASSSAGATGTRLELQLDTQQQPHEFVPAADESLLMTTPAADQPAAQLLGLSHVDEQLDTPSAEKLLDDLWLESTLSTLDRWTEDDLFPDLV